MEWPISRIRSSWNEFFRAQGHRQLPSASVVPGPDEHTLLFVNSGMVPFKRVFIAADVPAALAANGWSEAVSNSQRCVRAGGKHNDLEDVGKDTYHHTFFEMLGNWSFNSYFKERAISMAYELLTKVYKLDWSRVYVTYFDGTGLATPLPPDTETRDIWRKYIGDDRILPAGMADNFWQMAKTGPCGPCTEIHYDKRRVGVELQKRSEDTGKTPLLREEDRAETGAKLVNQDDPDVIEIWNLVFMQYDMQEDGSLVSLGRNCFVDTGCGLERLATVLQGVDNNYETDAFKPLFARIAELSGVAPYADAPEAQKVAYRIVADHARCVCVAMADGALPGPDGRGYVVRRIVRRAVRAGADFLNAREPWLWRLVPCVAETLGDGHPGLPAQIDRLVALLKEEEVAFLRTLEKGQTRFKAALAETPGRLSGAAAFQLYATYGFPIDLTAILCEEQAADLDLPGFHAAMAAHKDASAGARAEKGALPPKEPEVATDDSGVYAWDAEGATTPPLTTKVLRVSNGDAWLEPGDATDLAPQKLRGVILSHTNFYSEQGGQVGDSGMLVQPNATFAVTQTIRMGACVVHVGTGTLDWGSPVKCQPDLEARRRTAANHTATHLLNRALRDLLPEVTYGQRGSLVDAAKLRFDFGSDKALTDEQLSIAEEAVRAAIAEGTPVITALTPLADVPDSVPRLAGEAYPDPARLVTAGPAAELCGGTHAHSTGALGAFAITQEEAVAKGVRRVTAVTGDAARAILDSDERASTAVKALRTDLDAFCVGGALRLPGNPGAPTPEQVAGIKARIGELKGSLGGSYLRRRAQAATLAEDEARIAKWTKGVEKALATAAQALAARAPAPRDGLLVLSLPSLEGNRKALEAFMKALKSDADVLLLSRAGETYSLLFWGARPLASLLPSAKAGGAKGRFVGATTALAEADACVQAHGSVLQ